MSCWTCILPFIEGVTLFRYTDAHCHYVDFLQRTDGIQTLLNEMDTAGVYHIQIMGLPLLKKWNAADPREPRYYLEDDSRTYWYSVTDTIVARAVKELAEKNRQRYHPSKTRCRKKRQAWADILGKNLYMLTHALCN